MATLDFSKTPANKNVAVFISPTATGVLGVTDVYEPLADELNNTGGTSGMLLASKAISWNDWSFGTQASETTNEPSLADASTFEEFGQANYGGGISFYFPRSYDDSSNLLSNVYDLVDEPGLKQDIATRIDGEKNYATPAADGDFVSVYRVEVDAEAVPFAPSESKRYTKTFLQKSEFAHVIPVGTQTVTTNPATTMAVSDGDVGRIQAIIQGRDVGAADYIDWSTDDSDVIDVYPGGFYVVTGTGTANVTATQIHTGDSASIAVTAS